jgi:transposase
MDPWNKEDTEKLRELIVKPGLSWEEIAKEIGDGTRSVQSCQHRARWVGLKKNPQGKPRSRVSLSVVQERIANGDKVRDIAESLGVGAYSVNRVIRNAGIKRVKREEVKEVKKRARTGGPGIPWTPEEHAKLIDLVSAAGGLRMSEAAWKIVAKNLCREVPACRSTYQSLKGQDGGDGKVPIAARRPGGWSVEEMIQLAGATEGMTEADRADPGFWDRVSRFVETKNPKQCRLEFERPGGSGRWTVHEDKALLAQWTEHGSSWKRYVIPGRKANSIRERHRILMP